MSRAGRWPATRIAAWTPRPPLAVALDAPDGASALRWARAVAGGVAVLKIGMELFHREGPAVVHALRDAGLVAHGGASMGVGAGVCAGAWPAAGADDRAVTGWSMPSSGDLGGIVTLGNGCPDGEPPGAPALFLDLKLHDIPATVAGGLRSLLRLGPRFVTVHAAGGSDMVRAAVEAAGAEGTTEIAAVTVLTSLGESDLGAVGLAGPVAEAARRLAALAVRAGARALVCSPREVRTLREEVGDDVTLITPGVRPEGFGRGDQVRVATPREALEAGADLLVVGRPVTAAPDPKIAVIALVEALGPG